MFEKYRRLRVIAEIQCLTKFKIVERRSFGEGTDPKLLRDTPSRRPESLYAEAS